MWRALCAGRRVPFPKPVEFLQQRHGRGTWIYRTGNLCICQEKSHILYAGVHPVRTDRDDTASDAGTADTDTIFVYDTVSVHADYALMHGQK